MLGGGGKGSQDNVAMPAKMLRLAGVGLKLGVQEAVNSELREIASQPYDNHVFSVDSFWLWGTSSTI